ncbi:hypothetical protein PspLS_06099 [Pyricularia sp. CBS 133598]|nr:hypothetical protein PspLS_06099 [Pyricularia sp. CBS 133598]
MISRVVSRRSCLLMRTNASKTIGLVQRRGAASSPKLGDGPLMERRADRELPDPRTIGHRWSRSLPIFFVLMAASSLAIFNYQKMSSPVVASTLYALRIHPDAREYLGDNIYFKQQIPWIRGEMNQMHGKIDVWFTVKGTRNSGVMRFTSRRPSSRAMFETLEWSLERDDGSKIDLLIDGDPFKGIQIGEGLDNYYDDEDDAPQTRGFRK